MTIDRSTRMAAVRYLPGLIILILGFQWVYAFGEEIPTGQPPVPENVKPAEGGFFGKEGTVDRSHAYLDRKINGVVAWFDGFFGGMAEPDKPMAENKLQWSNELRAEKGNRLRFRTALNANLRLPKFEKRIRLVIMEENREEAVTPVPIEPGTPVVNTPTNANSLRAVHTELRYYARDTKAGYAFLAAGSRFMWPLETFVRARFLWRRPWADSSFISPSATPFWQDHIGFGITPQLDFGHTFAKDYIFLWTNSATVFSKKKPWLRWGTEVSLSRILSPASAIAFSVGASGSTPPGAGTDELKVAPNNYKVAVKYRRTIYRPWLFLEVVPETNWRRDQNDVREIIPALTVRLEMNSLGARALLPVPKIVKEQLPIPEYERD